MTVLPAALLLLLASLTPDFAGAASPDSVGLTPDLLNLQGQLFQGAFQSFVQDVRAGATDLHLDGAPLLAPAFDPHLTRNEWLLQFVDALTTQQKLGAADKATLAKFVTSTYYSGSGDSMYARVPFLLSLPAAAGVSAPAIRAVDPLPLLESYPSPHTMNLAAYVEQRFEQPLQDFIHVHHVKLYGHDAGCVEAIAYHQSQGFIQVERFMGSRDGSDTQFFIAFNPGSATYRFGACDLRGQDDATRIAEILGPVFKESGAFLVHHQSPELLIQFNDTGKKLAFGAGDRVVIGFQNTIWWQLTHSADAKDWERVPLTSGGLGVDLFRNRKSREQWVSVANMYGDETLAMLETFYSRGARRFLFMGTGGALDPTLKIGDALVPTRFLRADGSWIDFANDAAGLALAPGAGIQVKSQSRQGWVPTLIEESQANMVRMRDLGIQALDVETRYMAEFFQNHPATEKAVIITVSDLPLGGQSYDQEGAVRAKINGTVMGLVPQVLK